MIKWKRNTGALLLFVIFIFTLAIMPISAQAKTVNRYATQTIRLRNKAAGKTLKKVKVNTKVKLIKAGKKWARVKYKGQEYITLKKHLNKYKSTSKYTGAYFKRAGVIHWHEYKYTWYSQKVLYGAGLQIKGRHVDTQGFIRDNKGYIVLGTQVGHKGEIVATPFGAYGKVYDCGWVSKNHYDVFVNF